MHQSPIYIHTYLLGIILKEKRYKGFLHLRKYCPSQVVSRRPLTAEARVRSRASPYGVCGGQSGTGTGFSLSFRFSPVNFIPLVLHYL
jgi:hypothetical protein